MRRAIVITAILLTASTAFADGPAAQFQLGARPHVDIGFRLDLNVEGFDEAPAPEQPKLEIANATVTPLGVEPTGQMVQIIGNHRTIAVTWTLHYQVEPHKEGSMHVPATTVTQGSKHATAPAGDANVETVPLTEDMKLELQLPNRPVYVGETVEAHLVWLFKTQPGDPHFTVPLFRSPDDFAIVAPPVDPNTRVLQFGAAGKELALPFTADADGGFHRIRFPFLLAPRRSGKVEIAPATVAATLSAGRSNYYGDARMFRTTDIVRTLDVRPLPETDKPSSFAGAVGESYAMTARTSRSVVQLGEPVELTITVKSNQRLDTLSLPRLDDPGQLPKDRFTVPPDAPTGELSADGKTKTFKVTAQVTGPATEIPALAFAYFDPGKGAYQTIHSDPIALSVKGGSVVGASDVVVATPQKKTAAQPAQTDLSPVAADLALSSPGAVADRPLGGSLLWILVGVLYAVPMGVFGFRRWQVRTRSQREEAGEVRTARHKVEELLDRAAAAPARETAGPLAAALRSLARAQGRELDDNGLVAKLETESFSPTAGEKPLSADLRSDIAGVIRRWRSAKRAAAVAVLLLVSLAGRDARADAADQTLASGRIAYQDAMAATDATSRKAAFGRAAAELADAVHALPDRPELLTDWGNAALGAGDVATATLAYRRALALDASNQRARNILGWLRSRQSDAFRPAQTTAASGTLFFFHEWPRARRLLVGAAAFALAILLLVPRRRGLRALALLPAAAWLAMIVSLLVEDRRTNDAIVMDDVVMRAADSAGAPAAMAQSLPRGAEVSVLERRDAWTRVEIASGTSGWIPAGSVEPVR